MNRRSYFVLADVKARVADDRQFALTMARRESGCRYTPSRGTFIATSNAQGQCSPHPEAEAIEWRGTAKEIDEVIAKVLADYPECTEVYIAGGYDGADSVLDYQNGEYEPWVAAWSTTVWTRGSVQ
jgi:hypothetical protein